MYLLIFLTTILLYIFVLLKSPEVSSSIFDTDSLPNSLLILTDDQGYHDVSYYETEDIQTLIKHDKLRA